MTNIVPLSRGKPSKRRILPRSSDTDHGIFSHPSSEPLLLVHSATARIISANRAYGRLLGYDPRELAGQPLSLVVPEGEWPAVKKRIKERAYGEYRARVKHKHGHVLHLIVQVESKGPLRVARYRMPTDKAAIGGGRERVI